MLHVGTSPSIFLLFCMAVCDYASLVTGSCGASNSNPVDSECVLLNDCDKRNQGTPEAQTWGRTTLGWFQFENVQSLVFHLHEPISSLFIYLFIYLALPTRAGSPQQHIFYLTYTFDPISIKFIQPFLDDTFTTQAVLRSKKVKKGGPTFPEGAPEWWNCATC
jgi:hypothetical protein